MSKNYKSSQDTSASYNHEKRIKRRRDANLKDPVNDRTEFLFPKSREIFELVNDKYQLRDLINEENRKNQLNLQTHTYCFERGPRSYMYMKCIPCGHKQKLKYLKYNNPGQKFRLIYFDNTHNHTNFCKKSKHHYNLNQVFQEMKRTPKDMPIDEFKEHLKNKFGINDSNFYYMLSRFRKCHESIRLLIEWLKKLGCMMWTNIDKIDSGIQQDVSEMCFEQDPPFFMFILPQMMDCYNRYGQCTYFNVIRGLIKKRNIVQNRQWDLISFNGLSYSNRFAPFAVAFLQVSKNSIDQTVRIIDKFFKKTKRTPKTFVTPYSDKFITIMQKLKKESIFDGLHIFDGVEQLQEIQRIIPDINQFKYFQDIVNSTCRSEYYDNIQKLFKNIMPTLEIRKVFNELQRKASKMCFALIDTDNFIGMGFKYSANRFMTILVRYLFTHSMTSTKILAPKPKELYPSIRFLAKEYLKLMEPELTYIRYDTWKFQLYMNLPEMQVVRTSLKMSIMDIFLAQFHKVFAIDARQRPLKDKSTSEMKIYDIYDNQSRALYVVAARPEYDQEEIFTKFLWRCNCLYSIKCGMPCCHEIKVILLNGSSLIDQVHERWVQKKLGRKKAPGRPKISRRNTMK